MTAFKDAVVALVTGATQTAATQTAVVTSDVPTWLAAVRTVIPMIGHQWFGQPRPSMSEANEGDDPKVDRVAIWTLGNGDRVVIARIRP